LPNQVAFPHHEQESPPISVFRNGGTEGGPGMETMQKSKRTTPKIMHRAGELRKEPGACLLVRGLAESKGEVERLIEET
jgi:hypothetical protein